MNGDMVCADQAWLRTLEARLVRRLRLEHAANVFPLGHVLTYYAIFVLLAWHGVINALWLRALLWSLLVMLNYSLSIGVMHMHAHRKLFTSRWPNRVLEFLLCFPCVHDYPSMRYVHVYLHHRYEDGPNDPTSTAGYRTGWRMLQYWVLYAPHSKWITGRALFAPDAKSIWRRLRGQFLFDAPMCMLIAVAWAGVDLHGMVSLWLVPMLIVWTNIGFFAWLTHAPATGPKINGSFNTTNRWMNLLVHNQGFHVVHHRYPGVHWTAIPGRFDLMLEVDDRLIAPYWVLLTSAWHVATPRTLRDPRYARRWKRRYLERRGSRRVRTPLLPYFGWV